MSHASASMARVEHPTKSFGHVVTQVDDTWTVTQDNVALVAPFLNGEVLNLDVARTRSGTGLVDHGNCSLIVNEKRGSTRTESVELLQHVAKVFGGLRTCHGSIELGFGRTGGNNWLYSSLPSDGGIGKEQNIAGNGSP